MSNSCTPSNSCSPHQESCSAPSQNSCQPATPCSPGHAVCCPVEMTVDRWSGAFCQAMTEVQVEILKAKIKKNWGAQLEQVGDAMVEAMGIKWNNMLTGAKSQLDLRDKIKDIFMKG